jgi:hypothetical protein
VPLNNAGRCGRRTKTREVQLPRVFFQISRRERPRTPFSPPLSRPACRRRARPRHTSRRASMPRQPKRRMPSWHTETGLRWRAQTTLRRPTRDDKLRHVGDDCGPLAADPAPLSGSSGGRLELYPPRVVTASKSLRRIDKLCHPVGAHASVPAFSSERRGTAILR